MNEITQYLFHGTIVTEFDSTDAGEVACKELVNVCIDNGVSFSYRFVE